MYICTTSQNMYLKTCKDGNGPRWISAHSFTLSGRLVKSTKNYRRRSAT